MTFNELTTRLCLYLKSRINNGEFSERSLARVLQISQPHLHNILKGSRRLNAQIADHVMFRLKKTVLDLITEEEIWDSLDQKTHDWLMRAASRKPPVQAEQRQADPRAPWRESGGS